MAARFISRAAALAAGGLVLAVWTGATEAAPDPGSRPLAARADRGDLIVLDLYGSYRDMGRQESELLGPTARALADLYAGRWARLVRRQGMLGGFVDRLALPIWSSLGGWREDSGFFDEGAGIARALGERDADGVRWLYGAVFGGGSTAFAATRSATADGGAIVGRNVDWSDDTGQRRPVVRRYHPDNGDLVYLTASWPLIFVPLVGLNAAGLAISMNFFDADEMIGLGFPRILYRRLLQRARTVEDALALLAEGGNRGGASILVLADAGGAIAIAECAATRCSIHRPAEDWVAQGNHTRTAMMHDHDEGRWSDSVRRQDAMADAVRRRVGTITPEVAAEILRDRSNSRFSNDSTVANLRVLNAVVVHPASRTLWHSTTMQPIAPFGEMVPFSVEEPGAGRPAVAADPRVSGGMLQREVEVVAAMRQAERLFEGGRVGDAGRLWDRLAVEAPDLLEPSRLAWVRARVRWSLGRLAGADELLARADVDEAPFEVRAYARLVRAMVADRMGRRTEALDHYRRAGALLDAHPEYDAPSMVGPLRAWIRAGFAGAETRGRFPAMPDLQNIPR